MVLAEFDLFTTFRWGLAVVCTIYTIVVTWQSLWSWLEWFRSSPETARLGRYTAALLVRIRLRRFTWELLQIAALTVAFFYIVHLHYVLEQRFAD